MSRLLHLGNAVVDVVLTVPRWPEPGGDVLATDTRLAAGGGFNVMAAAARQGLPVAYGGAHGTGRFGDLVRAAMRAEGIEILQEPLQGADTGFVVTGVDASGERTFLTSPGAEALLARVPAPRPDDIVYVSGYGLAHPVNRPVLLDSLAGTGNLVIADPGPLQLPSEVRAAVRARADWWSCNAREAALATGRADPWAATEALSERGRSVLVRTGSEGCLVSVNGAAPVHVPGFAVEAVDTNGAGDAHTGVFIAALARGEDPLTAARTANAAAALAVTARGPATAPTAAELSRFLSHSG